jgi:hypothetical protein
MSQSDDPAFIHSLYSKVFSTLSIDGDLWILAIRPAPMVSVGSFVALEFGGDLWVFN